MKKQLLLITLLAFFSITKNLSAQNAPAIEWQKCLGGGADENTYSIQQTDDGGYIVAGTSSSVDGDVTGNHGSSDYWAVKLTASGTIDWQKSLGGTSADNLNAIQQTSDGGFILAGGASSGDGDVSGNHGNSDYWIVKLDHDGNILWQKSYGGSEADEAFSIKETNDAGFIVAGYSYSTDGDVSDNHGNSDFWIVRLDSMGNIEWQRCCGGSDLEFFFIEIEQIADGGYAFGAWTKSNDGDVSGNHGSFDIWIVKLNSLGSLEWQKCLGGSATDATASLKQISGGGFIVAGVSVSSDGDATQNHGVQDYWVLQLDSSGNIVWQKSLGGSLDDEAFSVQQTWDGGFIAGGYSNSVDGDITGYHGDYDYCVMKLDENGNLEWQKNLGGSSYDYGWTIQQTTDGGFITAGFSGSTDGDVTGNHGGSDIWVVKLAADTATGILQSHFFQSHFSVSLFPNPSDGNVHLEFTLNQEQQVQVKVFDVAGKELFGEDEQRISGSFTETIYLNSLPAGSYYISIVHGCEREMRKMMVVK
ncbi:MAG TPA: T9SS type A sorting domain-containing protein [Chitinophagales bacterium]|nr:T9SS type A sorting domain-containing protein [Chitinophagales bacterium]